MASEITAQSAGEKPLSARPPAIGRYTNVNFALARVLPLLRQPITSLSNIGKTHPGNGQGD